MQNHEIDKTWSPAGIYTRPSFFLFISMICALMIEDWQSEILKYADDTVVIEKLKTQADDKTLFQSRKNMNQLYLITPKRSLSYSRKDHWNIRT